MISCTEILELRKLIKNIWYNQTEVLSVLLGIYKENIGRVAISKMTGMTERRVRNIKNAYSKICDKHCEKKLEDLLGKLSFMKENKNEKKIIAIYPLSSDLLRIIETKIVYFRDLIVIEIKKPGALEVIGIVINEEIRVPGLPIELLKEYIDMAKNMNIPKNSIFTIWNTYRGLTTEATLIHAITNLCE